MKTAAYLAYCLLAVALLLEGVCRLGLIDTSVGHRAKRIAEERARDPKIVVLGDSFSEPRLGSVMHSLSKDVPILNFAEGGRGPVDYRRDRDRVDFTPDLVVVNYYVGNDLTDTAFLDEAGDGARMTAKRWLRKSYLGDALLSAWYGVMPKVSLGPKQSGLVPITDRAPVVNPALVKLAANHPDFLFDNILMESDRAQRAWAKNESLLLEIARRSRTVFFIFPSTVQVDRQRFPFYEALGVQTSPRFLETSRPQDAFLAFCRKNQLECVDLLPEFRRHANEPLWIENDDHWNTDGNNLAYSVMKPYFSR